MNNEAHQQQTPPPTPGQTAPFSHRPGRAALCAIIPGIGAVYNREYVKAVVHFSIFAGLTIIADTVSIFRLAAFAFYVFTIIDAYRSAEGILRAGSSARERIVAKSEEINLPLWGSILVLMGILFLLDNLGAIHLRSAAQFWPIILIALGAYLIFSFYHRERTSTQPPPADPSQSSSRPTSANSPE